MDCRLIIDEPASGAWNMAMDEALLESAENAALGACLRFYFWEQPTVSLGYFQSHEDRRRHESSRGCPLVRRSTVALRIFDSSGKDCALAGIERRGQLWISAPTLPG